MSVTPVIVFYVANATPFGLRVEANDAVTTSLQTVEDDEHLEANQSNDVAIFMANSYREFSSAIKNCVRIKTGQFRKFSGTSVRINDEHGQMIFNGRVAPGKSLIVNYSDASSGYSCAFYQFSESKKIISDPSEESSIWTAENNVSLKPHINEITLCEFCVANASSRPIIVSYCTSMKPNSSYQSLKVGPAECSVPINSRIVRIMSSDNTEILQGYTDVYSNRAIIVTENQTTQRSVIIDKDNKGTAVWIAEQNERNHFPRYFYVANASGSSLRVKAFTVKPSVDVHDATNGWQKERNVHSLPHDAYEEYRGGYVMIWLEEGQRICSTDVANGISVIVTYAKTHEFAFSNAIDKNRDNVIEKVWRTKNNKNYKPGSECNLS